MKIEGKATSYNRYVLRAAQKAMNFNGSQITPHRVR